MTDSFRNQFWHRFCSYRCKAVMIFNNVDMLERFFRIFDCCNIEGLDTVYTGRSSSQLSIRVHTIPIMLQHKRVVRKAKGSMPLHSLSLARAT